MKRFSFFAALAAVACAHQVLAQQPRAGEPPKGPDAKATGTPTAVKPPTFWKADLPGGSFVAAHAAIRSISLQQYIVDGAARVTEVNIDTAGAFKPRFYYVEPLPAEALQAVPGGQTAADHAQSDGQAVVSRVVPGDPIWAKVVKNYPTTTHAGTIEFRLETREQLDKLYESAERSWTSGKSEVYTPAGTQSYAKRKKSEAEDNSSPNADPTGDSGADN